MKQDLAVASSACGRTGRCEGPTCLYFSAGARLWLGDPATASCSKPAPVTGLMFRSCRKLQVRQLSCCLAIAKDSFEADDLYLVVDWDLLIC